MYVYNKNSDRMKFRMLLLITIFSSSFGMLTANPAKSKSGSVKIIKEESSPHPDTASVGIYITSIHDIDFRQKQYEISFWVWFVCENKEQDFAKYLEILQAKSISTTYSEVDDSSVPGKRATVLKLDCVMKDSWKIDNFPFNRQNLTLSIENAQSDIDDLVFVKDNRGKNYDAHALSGYGSDSLKGWIIDPNSFKVSIGKKVYETAFDDTTQPPSVYSTYKVQIGIKHEVWGCSGKYFLECMFPS